MGRRFTDTEKWKRPWFRALPVAYKCLWVYICDECDIAGTWYVDMDLATYQIGEKVELSEAYSLFAKQITALDDGARWQIHSFVPFQYGELTPNNNFHKSVIGRLDAIAGRSSGSSSATNSSSISAPEQPLTGPSRGAKDKEKDMYKEDVKDVGGSGGFSFDAIWARYPRKLGRKAAERHFKASIKTPQDYADLQNALDCFIRSMRQEGRPDDKIPYGVTWMNNWRDWINYGGVTMPKPPPLAPRPADPPAPDLSEDDLREMHDQRVTRLGPCRDPGCKFCKAEVGP